MRILVADDHSLFRDGLVSLLEAAGYEVVAQVGDGETAVQQAIELQPDLILLDITMPLMDGHDALKELRETLPETKVVILTVSDDDNDLQRAIKAGAHGYLLKSLDADEFLELLDGLQRDEAAITRQIATRLMAQIADPTSNEHIEVETLTDREIEILRHVERGYSNAAIAEATSISQNTVKYHMKNIFQKLDAQNRTEAVANAIRWGILKPDESVN
jgi:DNA-binding NarL/FixJ family response regulator